jgi:hypothetical protein
MPLFYILISKESMFYLPGGVDAAEVCGTKLDAAVFIRSGVLHRYGLDVFGSIRDSNPSGETL